MIAAQHMAPTLLTRSPLTRRETFMSREESRSVKTVPLGQQSSTTLPVSSNGLPPTVTAKLLPSPLTAQAVFTSPVGAAACTLRSSTTDQARNNGLPKDRAVVP